jgi:hypothetical protein
MVWVPLERVVVRNTVFWCTVRAEYAFTVATTLPSIDTVLFPELFVVRVMKATLVPVNVVDALPALDWNRTDPPRSAVLRVLRQEPV